MGFWIFMLLLDLLVPLSMIGVGRYFLKNGGPQKINRIFGYRTSMSLKNEDTWKFAHAHCGKSWWIGGCMLLPVSMGAMLFVLGKDIDTVGTVGGGNTLSCSSNPSCRFNHSYRNSVKKAFWREWEQEKMKMPTSWQ